MKYYSIEHSWNKKILGVYEPYKEFVDYNNINNSTHSVNHFLGKINYAPEIPTLILKDKAKLLDLMSHPSTIGFEGKLIISSKLKTIFEENKVTDLQFFEVDIFRGQNKIENYWLAHPCKEHLEVIDFDKSEIYISTAVRPIEKVNIKSVLHFKELREELGANGHKNHSIAFLFIENLVLLKENVKKLLKFNHHRGKGTYVINEELKQEIESKECTGIEFIPLEVSKEEFYKENGYRHKVYGYWP